LGHFQPEIIKRNNFLFKEAQLLTRLKNTAEGRRKKCGKKKGGVDVLENANWHCRLLEFTENIEGGKGRHRLQRGRRCPRRWPHRNDHLLDDADHKKGRKVSVCW